MKILRFIVLVLLALGTVGSVVQAFDATGASSIAKHLLTASILLTWAILLDLYHSKHYRGGAATIIGAVLLGVGVFSGVGELLWPLPLSDIRIWWRVLAVACFLGMGVALLIQGHQIHRLKSK